MAMPRVTSQTLNVAGTYNEIAAADGNDTIFDTPTINGVSNFLYDPVNEINGTKGNDVLHGTDEPDNIYGSDGDDSLFGHGAVDFLFGGNGADHLDGGSGYDHAWYTDSGAGVWVNLATGFGRYGTAQGDTLVSIEGVQGSRYDDVITGADVTDQGNNFYDGWLGNDTFIGGLVNEFMWGGDGNDTANYVNSNAGVTATLGNGEEYGHGYGGTAEGDEYFEVENLNGSFFNDTLTGNDDVNFLNGSSGDDILKGGGGADILYGGLGSNSGDDILKGGGGADILEGGAGVDTAAYNDAPTGVSVSLISNTGSYGDAEGDTLYNIENLTGSGYGDNLWGDSSANVLNGMDGNDSLKGGGGDDRLHGGSGADDFMWSDIDESGVTSATADVIRDFNFAAGDRIVLSGIDANAYAAGNQAFSFIGQANFSGTPGEINYVHVGNDTIIQLQNGMDPDVEAVIRLTGIHTPDASWFVL